MPLTRILKFIRPTWPERSEQDKTEEWELRKNRRIFSAFWRIIDRVLFVGGSLIRLFNLGWVIQYPYAAIDQHRQFEPNTAI